MNLFDFHHHNSEMQFGIYNLPLQNTTFEGTYSAGIHPRYADRDNLQEWMDDVVQNKNCVAIGECGLDGLLTLSDEIQTRVFSQQIALAHDLKKPLIIHCVRRFHQLFPLTKNAEIPLIIHGFNKKNSIGEELLRRGFYLSFGKSLLYNVNLQQFFHTVPPERIFLETDSTDCTLEEIYLKAADIKEISLESLAGKINDNLRELKIIDQ